MSSEDHTIEGAPKTGDVFAGKYRIERILGVGGMGYVLAATHLQLDQKVAIKMLLPNLAQHQDTVARFLREGRAAVKIRSEHVARVLDVGSHEGTHYIVMEYLEGCDLSQLLEREGRLPEKVAIDYVLQACEAIAEAHAMCTVHRDLKPANLFLVKRADGTPCVKVLDFGISKTTAPEGSAQLSMTKTSALMGSPLYMSPEQLKSSKEVDTRADIWAIGVILFELIAGRPPFLAETLPELGSLVLSGNVPDVREFAPETSAVVVAVIRSCLKIQSADRFPSIAELANALAPFGSLMASGSAERVCRVLENVARPEKTTWTSAALGAGSGPISAKAFTMTPSSAVQHWASSTALDATATADPNPPPQKKQRRAILPWMALGLAVATGTFGVKRFLLKHDATASLASGMQSVSVTTPVTTASTTPPHDTTPEPVTSPAVTTTPTTHATTTRHPSATASSAPIASITPTASTLVLVPTPSSTSGFSNNRHE